MVLDLLELALQTVASHHVWESNLGLLEARPVLLPAEPWILPSGGTGLSASSVLPTPNHCAPVSHVPG